MVGLTRFYKIYMRGYAKFPFSGCAERKRLKFVFKCVLTWWIYNVSYLLNREIVGLPIFRQVQSLKSFFLQHSKMCELKWCKFLHQVNYLMKISTHTI